MIIKENGEIKVVKKGKRTALAACRGRSTQKSEGPPVPQPSLNAAMHPPPYFLENGFEA